MMPQSELSVIIALVADLNDRGHEAMGVAAWSVHAQTTNCGESESIQVFLYSQCLWDSEEDDRLEIGICDNCKGCGKIPIPVKPDGAIRIPRPDDEFDPALDPCCGVCGGSGTVSPLEPLAEFLPRAAFEYALGIIAMTRPRTASEVPMAHDAVSNEWIEPLARLRSQLDDLNVGKAGKR